MAVKTKKAPIMVIAECEQETTWGTVYYRLRQEEGRFFDSKGEPKVWRNNILESKNDGYKAEWSPVGLANYSPQSLVDIMARMVLAISQPLG